MRSRNTLLLLVFLLLAGFAAYYFLNKNNSKSTLDSEETSFAIADTASVDKIFISTKSGVNNTLTRKPGNKWVINDRYEARKDLVNMLLETMKRMEVKRPADKLSRNSAIRDIAAMGRKVEVYQNGELAKTFYVGQTTDEHMGTYFIMEGSEEPYVLHMPGFVGFITNRFDVEEAQWRSVPVFRSSAATITKLEISYPQKPEGNFSIEKVGDQFKVSGVAAADQENVKAYLDTYKFINGEFFLENPHNRVSDSLTLQKPVIQMKLTDAIPENSVNLLLYARPDNGDKLIALKPETKEVIT